MRGEITELRQEVQTKTSNVCLFSGGSDVEALMEAIQKERHDRASQMADHEQRIEMMSGLTEKIDGQVSRHEGLIMHMWQERDLPGKQSNGQLTRGEPSSASDISSMLESLQQRLREEVSAVISKHQSQYAELRDLITRLFEQQTATLASDGIGPPDSAMRRQIQSLVKELVQHSVEEQVQQVLAHQQRSQIQLQAQAQAKPQAQVPSQPQMPPQHLQNSPMPHLPLGIDTPPVRPPMAIGVASPRSPPRVCVAGLQPGLPEAPTERCVQPASPTRCFVQPISSPQVMKAQTTVVPVMDAATAALAASAVVTHPNEGFGPQNNLMDGRRSPFTPPSQSRSHIPTESLTLVAGEASCMSPGAGSRALVNTAFNQQVASLSVGAAPPSTHPSGGASGANTPRAGSGSRNSSRSWPSTTCHSAAAPPPRLAATAPTVGVSLAGGSGSTCAGGGGSCGGGGGIGGGGGGVTSLGAGMARMASYAQRRRLATSRGAAPTSAMPTTPAAAQPLYSARGTGLVVRQCNGQGECRPKSHEQHQRCLRLRSTR